jgi:hypothetical protein
MSILLDALQCLVDNGFPEDEVAPLASDLLRTDGLDDDDDKKSLILVAEFGASYLDADPAGLDEHIIDAGGQQWLVCDDDEKESRWDACLDSYLDDGCVEGADGPYFDREAWKRDARMDGAGHALSGYDGDEHEFNANGVWYYMYRQN